MFSRKEERRGSGYQAVPTDAFSEDLPLDDNDDFGFDAQPEATNCCQRNFRRIGNVILSGSFSLQNSSLYVNTLYLAAKQFGWIKPGEELKSGVFGVILAGGAVLFVANGRSYYLLLEDFVGKSGGVRIRCAGLSWQDAAKKGLGIYVSLAKVAASAVSTYTLTDTLAAQSGNSQLAAGMVTGLTGIGNFACNLSVFLRPKNVDHYMMVEKILLQQFLVDTLGDEHQVHRLLRGLTAIYEDNTLGNVSVGLSHLFTFFYSLQNALLYEDAYYSFTKNLGLIAADTPGYKSPYFWLFMVIIGSPVFVGNYLGYYPLMKETFRSRAANRNVTCAQSLQNVFGRTGWQRFWNGVGLGGAFVKFAGTAFSTAKVGIDTFQPQATGALAGLLAVDSVVSLATGAANFSIYTKAQRQRVDHDPELGDGYDSDLDFAAAAARGEGVPLLERRN